MNKKYTHLLDQSIISLMKDAIRISLKMPSKLFFFMKAFLSQKKMAKRRSIWEKKGIHVPPFMIASITNRCNLKCKGCYNQAQHRNMANEMSAEKLNKVIEEASDLGISFILLAGGEPLVRKEIMMLASKYRDIIFPLFTNGMLINANIIKSFKRNKNMIPVISIEGYEKDTDERRGPGVYKHLIDVLSSLKSAGVFFGTSITVTKENYSMVTSEKFVGELVKKGCRLFFFVEYIPVSEGTEGMILDGSQHERLQGIMNSLRNKFTALFISFPGDEEQFGGCLSAGRGFVHISPEGNLEPCPFAPYSDTGLRDLSLKDALQSEFLKKIRENYRELSETSGGCALWENREWVKSLL